MRNILEYLEKNYRAYPERIALEDQKQALTYAALYHQARSIGSRLAKEGWRNRPVGVLIRRNIESIVMFLGVAYSGNFYVPLDKDMPAERLEKMLLRLSPAAVLGLREDLGAFEEYSTISYEELLAVQEEASLLEQVRAGQIDEDPLYAIFTSGSTGIPKSVVVSHRGVLDLTEQFAECFSFSEGERIGNQAPFDFDVSVKDIYQALRQGGTLVVIPREFFTMPAKLISFLNEKKISTVIWAVSALRIVAQLKAFRKEQPHYLKNIMFSGEVMPVKVLNYWQEALPDTAFTNLYGPTEITCNCTYYNIDRPYADEEVLPIGKPFANTRIYLLDENGRSCKAGQVGEILVGGAGVALGYYGDAEKTDASFIQNPLNPQYRELLYRTGDLGILDEEGMLWFQGRADHQIKHMGHRIELGEIEAAVTSLSFVDIGCCLYDDRKGKIVLFYQAKEHCDKEILGGLSQKLPKYMWPNKLIRVAEFSLNTHAKIDRIALKRRYFDGEDL